MGIEKAKKGSASYTQKVGGKWYTVVAGKAPEPGTPANVLAKAKAAGVAFIGNDEVKAAEAKGADGMPIKQVRPGSASYTQKFEGKWYTLLTDREAPAGTPERVIAKAKEAGLRVLAQGEKPAKQADMGLACGADGPSVVAAASGSKKRQRENAVAPAAAEPKAAAAVGKPYESEKKS